jgi:hypothetical protein
MTYDGDRNDLVTAQEKLEWVAPQISLLGGAGSTLGGKVGVKVETNPNTPTRYGPS